MLQTLGVLHRNVMLDAFHDMPDTSLLVSLYEVASVTQFACSRKWSDKSESRLCKNSGRKFETNLAQTSATPASDQLMENSNVPMHLIHWRTTSPGFRKIRRDMPTPAGVPVRMTSPGWSVIRVLR